MGRLSYGPKFTAEFEDVALAHLQIVIGIKFRRKESFFFTWRDEVAEGSGRTTLWLQPSIPLTFRYSIATKIPINRDWLEVLSLSANAPQGLMLTHELTGESAPHAPLATTLRKFVK